MAYYDSTQHALYDVLPKSTPAAILAELADAEIAEAIAGLTPAQLAHVLAFVRSPWRVRAFAAITCDNSEKTS